MFRSEDESEFKRLYAVQFLAAMDAVHYDEICTRKGGWKTHEPAVEEARFLAEKAWDEWKNTIGLEQSEGE